MTQQQFLGEVLQGRQDAMAFCTHLFRLSQVMDDLYDRDQPVTGEQLQLMFWEALVELPSNAFYQANFAALQPLVRVALLDWIDSTTLEATADTHDLSLAFVLRDSLTGVVSHCAYLIGGYAWMTAVSPSVRRFFHDEALADYTAGFKPPDPPQDKAQKAQKAKENAS